MHRGKQKEKGDKEDGTEDWREVKWRINEKMENWRQGGNEGKANERTNGGICELMNQRVKE